MSPKQLLLEQFQTGYRGSNWYWYVSMMTAIESLTTEQAAWKDDNTNNSIWQIINHLIFWNTRYLNRFKGIPVEEMKGDNDSTFEGERINGTDEDWNKTIQQLKNVMSDWENSIKEADDIKLEEKPVKETDGTWASYIGLINTHNAYHIGQIVTLRKLQGSWDKSKGIN